MTKGEQTRQRVVAEAAKLFNQRGYEGSSMLDIMQATGLEKGGIYRHFASKEELAQEAFDYAWNLVREARTKDLAEIGNTVDRLKQWVTNFVEVRPVIPGGCPLMNTAVEADDGNAALRKRAVAALRGWRTTIAEITQAGIERDEIRPTASPESVATVIISCLEGALMMSRLEHDREALHLAKNHLHDDLESSVRLQDANETISRETAR
jgi:TetR/AcrR family transcriptional repressor of nem operon